MKLRILSLVSIAIILLFGACSNENPVLEKERTISLTVSMPDDHPTTRISLDQIENRAIVLRWIVGDEIDLAFVQNGTIRTSTAQVISISDDGKRAEFQNVALPSGISAGPFNLYGVYGGGGLSENSTNVTLPVYPGDATSLEQVENRKDVMLFFALENFDSNTTSVSFKHLGSLFSIRLKNTGNISLDNLQEARLVGVGGGTDERWAYNSGEGGKTYNLLTEQFQDSESGGNFISFKTEINSLPSGGVITFWGWYPPLSNKVWPELILELRDASTELANSINSRPARTSPTEAGKSYYFHAEWDGSKLEFTNYIEGEVAQIPHIYIDTDGGVPIVEKRVYIGANVRIVGGDKYDDFEGRGAIRGRGNTTWAMPKKPYRFKLDDAASLLGLAAERNWVLLQNYIDPSLMCNSVAMRAGQLLEMPFTHHMIPVDVTLNGEYIGAYTFTEHKEVTENRINVGEGGWLIELDTNFDEDYQFISNQFNLPVMISHPDLGDLASDEADMIFNEIKNDFNSLEQLIYNESFPNNNYLDYFDSDAFVDYLIVYMLTDNEEINHPKSTYIYKKNGGKYSMGPIWDFDWAFGLEGGVRHFDDANRNLFWTGTKAGEGTAFFTRILEDPAIIVVFKREWPKFKNQKYPILVEYIKEYAETIRESHARDQEVWGQSSGSIDVYRDRMLDWLDRRVTYIDNVVAGL